MKTKHEGSEYEEKGEKQETDEYLSEEFIEESIEGDEISPTECWFIEGWKSAV